MSGIIVAWYWFRMPRRVAILKKCFLPLLVAGASALPIRAGAQVLLYEETFPWPGPSGNLAVSTAGWAAVIPNNPQRLFQLSGSDGAVFAFQANTIWHSPSADSWCHQARCFAN